MKRLFVCLFILILSATTFIACEPSDEEIRVNIETLLGAFGLKSNIFDSEPRAQLGSLIFYTKPEMVKALKERFLFEGPGDVVIQVQGVLAEDLRAHANELYKGAIRLDEAEVIYIFGELAQDLFQELKRRMTIDDVTYFEGKEVIVIGGSEAITFKNLIQDHFVDYFYPTPLKAQRIFFTSYENATTYTRDVFYTFYEDFRLLILTNPLEAAPCQYIEGVYDLGSDITEKSLEGLSKISVFTGTLWVFTFDNLSKAVAYLTGSEIFPESVLVRRTTKWVADTGYLTFYTVAEVFDDTKLILKNPFVIFNVVSSALKNTTELLDHTQEDSIEIIVGYVSDNMELLGGLLNIFHENIVGDLFIFLGETVSQSIHITSLSVKTILRFGGNGVSALVGTFSVDETWNTKKMRFENVLTDLKDNLLDLWHELMKLLRFR